MRKKTCEAVVAEYVIHISEETEKLRHTIIAKPDAVITWIRFNLNICDWKQCISGSDKSIEENPNFFDDIDFEEVLNKLKTHLGIQS
jgi:hypothetical protein